eukprot:6448376-Amphidinium_carterae.1
MIEAAAWPTQYPSQENPARGMVDGAITSGTWIPMERGHRFGHGSVAILADIVSCSFQVEQPTGPTTRNGSSIHARAWTYAFLKIFTPCC